MLNLRKHLKEAEWKALAEQQRAIATVLDTLGSLPSKDMGITPEHRAPFEAARASLNKTGHTE
jgi:hypothetical protein